MGGRGVALTDAVDDREADESPKTGDRNQDPIMPVRGQRKFRDQRDWQQDRRGEHGPQHPDGGGIHLIYRVGGRDRSGAPNQNGEDAEPEREARTRSFYVWQHVFLFLIFCHKYMCVRWNREDSGLNRLIALDTVNHQNTEEWRTTRELSCLADRLSKARGRLGCHVFVVHLLSLRTAGKRVQATTVLASTRFDTGHSGRFCPNQT